MALQAFWQEVLGIMMVEKGSVPNADEKRVRYGMNGYFVEMAMSCCHQVSYHVPAN
jgi:hypothetical protein